MEWSYKFAFDEIQEMMDNRPWLLVDDEFSSANHDEFLGMQKRLFIKRGWEWFTNVIRGRFFPQLNLTTVTTWDRERNPGQGDPDISRVEQNFPGVSIVSLIGGPHIIAGPEVDPEVLNQIAKIADAQHWNQKIASDTWKLPAAGMAGGALALLLSLGIPYDQIEKKMQNGATPQQIMNEVAPENPYTVPDFTEKNVDFEENVPENTEISQKMVDISTLVDNIIQIESSGDPNATSPVGARGLMQIMPPTWKEWSEKVFGKELPFDQAYDPDINVRIGTAYLEWIQNTLRQWMGQEPGVEHILAAYNGGIGRLRQVNFEITRMPAESRNYVQKVTQDKQGSISGSYHYAYQEIDLIRDKQKGKQIVKQFAEFPWQSVVEELRKAGIPKGLFGKLFGVYQVFRSQVYANNWNHIYAENSDTG